MKLKVTGATDTGRMREHNQDNYTIFADDSPEPKTGIC
jgi:serine/threonine protein phosphatase PrpC